MSIPACMAVSLPRVTPMQAEWAAQKWPGTTLPQLEEARALYVNRCSGCHNVPLPKEHPLEKWEVLVSSMSARAKLQEGEKEMIMRYITTSRLAPEN